MTTSNEATERALLDDDGENRAVRSFLMQYGVPGLTVHAMRKHMERSGWGFDYCPDFAKFGGVEHLTKAVAQIWIRHLFALEARVPSPAPVAPQPAPEVASMSIDGAEDGTIDGSPGMGRDMPIVPERFTVDPMTSERNRDMLKKIDRLIMEAAHLLNPRHDRRGPVRPHEPERRAGFDRRARSEPTKD